MRILSMIIKDLKVILSDKKALGTILLMPVILTSILSAALQGNFGGEDFTRTVDIAIVKEYDKEKDKEKLKDTMRDMSNMVDLEMDIENMLDDNLDMEKIFFDEFLGNEDIKKFIDYKLTDREKAISLLKDGEVDSIVILPDNFLYDMNVNFLTTYRNEIDIKVVGDPDKSISTQIIESIMMGFTENLSSMIIGKNVFIEKALEEGGSFDVFNNLDTVIENISEELEESRVVVKNITIEGKKPISSFGYYSIAMTTMFILFSAGLGGRALLEEKDNTTYQRMIVSGTSKADIIAGKFFTIFSLALIQITTMITFSTFVLGVDWGNIINVVAISLLACFAVSGLGILISSLTFKSGNYKMANVFETVIIQGMALVGGSFFPVEIMPSFVQKLSLLSVNGLALKSFHKVMMGYEFKLIWKYLLSLFGIGVLCIAITLYVLKERGRVKNA
ncbi:ABC transporter permease [Clostridium sp. D2Q-11]|uniref:ABC transporter permease n=1 Tax=Anaeromonas frigoriresistens TaxID=2683708 RepID=A0A942UUU9_9FIRM|nr:ABC transporter permease [Anaeromonas frigoriresistens]MBS4537910.1 ABC transporter permease [Anaeromonas frigoriresistens]